MTTKRTKQRPVDWLTMLAVCALVAYATQLGLAMWAGIR